MKKYGIFILLFFLYHYADTQNPAQHLIINCNFDNTIQNTGILKTKISKSGNIKFVKNRFNVDCAALHLDGNSSFIEIQNSPVLDKLYDNFTITVWAKLDANANNKIFSICCKSDSYDEDFNLPQFRFQISEKQYSISTFNTDTWTQNFNKDEWYFLALTLLNNNLKIYINANLVLNTYTEDKIYKNNQPVIIGRDKPGTDEFFHGDIDDFRIYDIALNNKDIRKIYRDNSDKKMNSPCFEENITSISCNNTVKSGGKGITINKMDLGTESGTFTLEYNMYNVPDKLIIYSGSDNSVIFETDGFVSGRKTLKINFAGTRLIIIKVIGNQKNTKWNYKIICPQ